LRSFLLFFLLMAVTLPAWAASPVKARPLAGIGVLTVREGGADLVIYREPGLGRVSEIPASKLPGIAPSLGPVPGVGHAVVLSTRPGWLRIIHDEAESPGWLERRRGDRFRTWGEFFRGRSVSMLAGLRQDYYQLRRSPSPLAETVASVERGALLQVGKVEGDWIHVRGKGETDGWLRWRDDNSRLLIAVTAPD